jgi:hypothetical protein
VHLARRDGEVDAVEGDDLAKALGDPARANGEVTGCRDCRQLVSGLGM